MKQQQGFTLIEMLVSLVVLSILGVVLALGMQQVTQWQQRLLTNMQDASAQLRFQSLLMNDLLQVAPRAITDAYGGRLPACLSLPEGGFECSRFDQSIGGQGVVRVGYALIDGALWRLRWPVLDRAPTTEPSRQLVLTGVDRLVVRWQDGQGTWLSQWPVAGSTDLQQLPVQIEVVLMHQTQEVFRRWFPVSELVP